MPRKPLAGGVLCLLLASGSGYARRIEAQSPSGRVPLAEAVQGIEKTLGAPNVSARERYAALARRARLFRLAGDLEGAARSWAEAGAEADGNSGNREAALLEAAFCLFALGELENAELAVKSAIESAKDREIIRRAIYLFAQIQVVRSGDLTPLSTLINNSDYERHKPGIYYFLWRYSGAGQYKNRLLSEYPESPEAFMVRERGEITIAPTPMWLLFPGREGVTFERPRELPDLSLHLPAPPVFAEPERKPVALQAGVFSREANAAFMAERLNAAGFESVVSRRASHDGGEYWVVTVPPGTDAERTISRLKDKGFDTFPIF